MPPLVLASTSRYRAQLLARLGLPFESVRPEVDERPLPGEPPATLALRLAAAKAGAVAAARPDALVLGSDQVASCDGRILGKPGNRDAAIAQLQRMSGREAVFLTAVALARAGEPVEQALDTTTVRVRHLSADEIVRYVDAESPLDCAGSFKSEGLGITLFESIESRDPTALVGLPLIATVRLLRARGVALP
ncbi:Maf family protein [Luteimonas wenzhouensis]|jgi:septum formation protein|uniref:7-methyl-GTP pyrophosphatase n=1 Tax=Luteimonas wenzhouensis TaxID=2599615 RepID=A0A5C5U340_9GAMM|nr:nucleoside triphosphate pyrophosphatase [Luteimonas wenzhouensis]NLW97416.1 septum formation inhibitor Maf [Xanthomonadaceae bacterium]TWT20833.1 septum formation inhibitor Maf [Luteimonas wenzhouensis]